MASKARLIRRVLAAAVIAGVVSTPVTHAFDFGAWIEENLSSLSEVLFGFGEPLGAPATAADVVPRAAATAQQRQLLAGGLEAVFVARNVASLGDMIAFWPDDLTYTHLIICIEQVRSGTTPAGNGGLNAAVQRVAVATGVVETILHGMSRCDGIRTTPLLLDEYRQRRRGDLCGDPLHGRRRSTSRRHPDPSRVDLPGRS
jgi:hypothetical protein